MPVSKCQFSRVVGGWTCSACGRVVRSESDKPPLAVCGPKPGFVPPQPQAPSLPPAPTSGPGTELKKLLAKIGITATPNCSCNARARTMDASGCEWCEAHLDEIVGWLREEATKRGLPFIDAAGRMLVRRAIKNARKAALTNKAT